MEKCEDIMREMRDRNEVRKVRLRQYGGVHCNCSIMPDDLPKVYADRFEAAYKAETEALDKIAKDAMVYITKVKAERDHEKKIANFAIDNIAKIRAEGVMLIYDMKTDAETRDSFSPADVRDYIRRIKDALFPVDRTDEKK